MLKDKKVLFIAPSFFGYEKDIAEELAALGAEVDYFDERPFTSSIAKILNRLNFKFFIKKNIKQHFNKIINKSASKKYDFIFVISPETIDKDFLNKIKSTNENMMSILYMWDSLRNKSNAKKLLPCFDKVYSFDSTDRNNGTDIKFLPLFYNNDFVFSNLDNAVDKLYSVSFIGTVHSDRVKLAKMVMKQFKDKGFDTYSFFYCPSRLLFILKKIFTKEFDFISYNEVSFNSMSKKQIRDVFLKSNAVIDIQHPDQTGLTMRSVEMLGLNRKLITTNLDIKNYDFFNDNNIAIIDRNSPFIPNEFITSNYMAPNKQLVYQYSLQNWVRFLFKKD
ncbi:hypothetical protein [uncultured Shewanella sp.]|uniref:hypothetical protein n=1 Tax=uncultured Shewanella sp. TaxID=173975 RepID=UPI00261E0309|nr:hypothetical protein [uncultured Shewanella sp.]